MKIHEVTLQLPVENNDRLEKSIIDVLETVKAHGHFVNVGLAGAREIHIKQV